jgi:arylsulfatase A-like enzyme
MVICLDDQVGRVVASLEARGMRKDTLLFFVSDNGGDVKAGAQNGPLKSGKLSLSEGGIRAVAVANWPDTIPAGTHVEELMHITDLYPTLVGLAGGSIEQALPVDGRDVWQTIARGAPSPHDEVPIGVGETRGALRSGKWKLETAFDAQGRPERIELYDLVADPFEQRNVGPTEPEVLRDLMRRLLSYRDAAVPAHPPPRYPKREIPAVWGGEDDASASGGEAER